MRIRVLPGCAVRPRGDDTFFHAGDMLPKVDVAEALEYIEHGFAEADR